MSLSPYVCVATFIHSFFFGNAYSFSLRWSMGQQVLYFTHLKAGALCEALLILGGKPLNPLFEHIWHFTFYIQGDIKDHQLLLYPNLLFYVLTPAGFSTVTSHGVLRHLALWYCIYNLFHNIFCHLVMHSLSYWCYWCHWSHVPSQWARDSVCAHWPSNPCRTTLVYCWWIQRAAFGGADTAAFFHRGPH